MLCECVSGYVHTKLHRQPIVFQKEISIQIHVHLSLIHCCISFSKYSTQKKNKLNYARFDILNFIHKSV